MGFYKSQRGVHSLEVIIAITLFALMTAGVFILFGSSITESNGLLRHSRANALVLEGQNAARSIRDADWDILTIGQHGLQLSGNGWSFSGSTDQTNDIFTRSVTINDLGENGKDVIVEVYWNFWGRIISAAASTRFTNWENLVVWGNWGNPVVVGSLDIGPQGQASGVIRNGNYAFLTAEISSGNRPSLYSINIADPTAPYILDEYSVGASLLDLALIGDYLYVVGKVDNSELIIFDVSDPANLVKVGSVDLDYDGLSIDVSGSTVYIGTEEDVFIYDAEIAESPSFLSKYHLGEDINDILLNGNYLYSATSKSDQEILILSVSDLGNPIYAGAYDVSGSTSALSLGISGSVLYMGSENNSSTNPELYQFDATDPVNLVKKNSRDVGGGIQEISTAGPYVYLATGSSNNEFQVWQTGSNWELLYHVGLNMAQMATGITFDDNTVFISLRSNDAFQVIQPSP